MTPIEARNFLIQVTDLLPVPRSTHQRVLDAIEALFKAAQPPEPKAVPKAAPKAEAPGTGLAGTITSASHL
jgi:hypothetical protein